MYPDKELIALCREGNQLAIRKLVEKHQRQVRATVVGMLGDTVEAGDVAQEVFIRFFNALADFRGDAKPNTYLTRIAVNLSLNEIKRQQRKNRWLVLFQKEEKINQIEDETANPDRQDTKELVHRALQLLEPEFRSVVVLRMLDGYSVKETAEILKLPNGTVASRLARGQNKLKIILNKFL